MNTIENESELTNILSNLIKTSEIEENNFKEQFTFAVHVFAYILIYKKEKNNQPINKQNFLELLELQNLFNIYKSGELPDIAQKKLETFLNTIPGVNAKEDLEVKQSSREQYDFLVGKLKKNLIEQ